MHVFFVILAATYLVGMPLDRVASMRARYWCPSGHVLGRLCLVRLHMLQMTHARLCSTMAFVSCCLLS